MCPSLHAGIATVGNQRVILDRDLAERYRVETRVLLKAVRRNAGRYPLGFLVPDYQ
ncbi:MAG: ORF6N domain-containing protein [Pseudomonadota bacterium]